MTLAKGGYVVNLDRSRLESAPAYTASEMSVWDDQRGRDIDPYYGLSGGRIS